MHSLSTSNQSIHGFQSSRTMNSFNAGGRLFNNAPIHWVTFLKVPGFTPYGKFKGLRLASHLSRPYLMPLCRLRFSLGLASAQHRPSTDFRRNDWDHLD